MLSEVISDRLRSGDIKRCAKSFLKAHKDWGKNVGLYVQVFGYAVVRSLHVHVIDKNFLGPSFHAQAHCNLPLDDVIAVLEEELNPIDDSDWRRHWMSVTGVQRRTEQGNCVEHVVWKAQIRAFNSARHPFSGKCQMLHFC